MFAEMNFYRPIQIMTFISIQFMFSYHQSSPAIMICHIIFYIIDSVTILYLVCCKGILYNISTLLSINTFAKLADRYIPQYQ